MSRGPGSELGKVLFGSICDESVSMIKDGNGLSTIKIRNQGVHAYDKERNK